jgi:hypothetical protein
MSKSFKQRTSSTFRPTDSPVSRSVPTTYPLRMDMRGLQLFTLILLGIKIDVGQKNIGYYPLLAKCLKMYNTRYGFFNFLALSRAKFVKNVNISKKKCMPKISVISMGTKELRNFYAVFTFVISKEN